MGWTIGCHRVEERLGPATLSIVIDDREQLTVARRVLGEWPFLIGKREARLRRVRNLDVARSELWIAGRRIPSSPDSLTPKRARRRSTTLTTLGAAGIGAGVVNRAPTPSICPGCAPT